MDFQEFLSHAFSPVNAVLSILVLLSIIYWIITIIGGIDHDIDLDFQSDIDGGGITTDIHQTDASVDISHEPSEFIQFLKFLNLDVIPITFFLTMTLLFTWLFNFNLSYYIPMNLFIQIIILFPVFFISLILTKYLLIPLKPIFKEMNHKGEISYDFLGRVGIMKATIEQDKLGMLELIINKDPIKLMVKSKEGIKINEGDKAMIVDESPDKKFYFVEKTYDI